MQKDDPRVIAIEEAVKAVYRVLERMSEVDHHTKFAVLYAVSAELQAHIKMAYGSDRLKEVQQLSEAYSKERAAELTADFNKKMKAQ